MKKIFNIITYSLMILFNLANGNPTGKYCGNIVGNQLNISMNQTSEIANISADVFGNNIDCPNEKYSLNQTNVNFPKDKSDCLNKFLNQYGQCPCPPNIIYNQSNDELIIPNNMIGDITLSKC